VHQLINKKTLKKTWKLCCFCQS